MGVLVSSSLQQNAGNRQCVGKTLARVELALVITTLLRQYKVNFAPGYEPSTMWRDMRDQVTAQPGRVICVFEPLGSGESVTVGGQLH